MGHRERKKIMTDQNSIVEIQIRPNELMDQLGIKKDAYYSYLKALDITAEKDSNNKAFLTEDQAKAVRLLRQHVVAGGKIDEFDLELALESALAVAESVELGDVEEQSTEEVEVDPSKGVDMQSLYLEASEMFAQHITADRQLLMAMLSEMSYETMHPDSRAKVDKIREAALPKFNPRAVARDFLSQCRQQMQAA